MRHEADERLDEVALGRDDVLDVLVRLRSLGEVEPPLGLAVAAVLVPPLADDAVHRLVALLDRQRGRGRDAAHAAAGAVRAAHERVGVAESAHDVARRAHRARDHADLVLLRRGRALAVDEHLLAEMILARRVVVVDVDRPKEVRLGDELRDSRHHDVHHASAVLIRVAEREEHVREVVVSVLLRNREEREVGVRKRHSEARAEPARDAVVVLLDALAEVARPRVDHKPHLRAAVGIARAVERR